MKTKETEEETDETTEEETRENKRRKIRKRNRRRNQTFVEIKSGFFCFYKNLFFYLFAIY
jgi:hypothetical protein